MFNAAFVSSPDGGRNLFWESKKELDQRKSRSRNKRSAFGFLGLGKSVAFSSEVGTGRVKKTRQNKRGEPGSDLIRTE
jgi:hypothetical protein